jgi:hypothetical protein
MKPRYSRKSTASDEIIGFYRCNMIRAARTFPIRRLSKRPATNVYCEELAAQVSSFQPEIDGACQCPECWIKAGRRLRIVAVPSNNAHEKQTPITASPATTKSLGCYR